jgi:predicted site-specific integrase-resolvase
MTTMMRYRGNKAIAVARVSTKRQAQGDGFRRQFDYISEWCDMQGIIVLENVQLAASAASSIDRIARDWKPLSDACSAHQPDWVVFHEYDRATRCLDASVWLYCLNNGKTGTLIALPLFGMNHELITPDPHWDDN